MCLDRAVAILVFVGRRRGDRRDRRRGGVREVGVRDLEGGCGGRAVRVAGDEGAAGGEGGGIGGGLHVPALRHLAADVDRESGEREQQREEDGEDHEHLTALGAAAHQFTTIVADAVWTKRPPPSVERRSPMNGTMMSDR